VKSEELSVKGAAGGPLKEIQLIVIRQVWQIRKLILKHKLGETNGQI
jgi:hypothetical protein